MSDSARFRRTGRWLLGHEAQGRESAVGLAEAGARVIDQLAQGLTLLIGLRGAQLLVARALRTVQPQYAFLRAATAAPETPVDLARLPENVAELDPALVGDALSAVIAEALALLSDFIGTGLVLRQIQRIWPELPGAEAPLDEEVGHEPA